MKQFLTHRLAKKVRIAFLIKAHRPLPEDEDFWVTLPRGRRFDPRNSYRDLML